MAYLETGLNVVYGTPREDLDSFSDECFEEYLEFQVRLSDDRANMDW